MASILKDKDIFLRSINGGSSESDLAQFCEVIINTNLNPYELFKQANAHITKMDNNLCFSKDSTQNILKKILSLKGGYITEDGASANLGKITTTNDEVKIYYLLRSSDERKLEKLNEETSKLDYHFKTTEIYRDSIWQVNKDSLLCKKYKKVYYDIYHEYPKEEIGHGGLECSAIKKRIENLDIISIGANIKHYHTPKETTYLDSWVKAYTLLTKLLETL